MTNKQTICNDSPCKDKLYQVLLEEISAYQYLAETIKQKQDAIIRNQLEELENLTGVERLLVKKVENLVQARQQYLHKIAQSTDGSVSMLLSQYIDQLNDGEKPRWRSIEQRIRRYVERIRRINLENQQLIRASLNYINGLVEMLYPHQEGIYNALGEENAPAAAKPILNVNV